MPVVRNEQDLECFDQANRFLQLLCTQIPCATSSTLKRELTRFLILLGSVTGHNLRDQPKSELDAFWWVLMALWVWEKRLSLCVSISFSVLRNF